MRYDIAVIGNDEAALELLCISGSQGFRTLGILPEQRHSSWIVSEALRRIVAQLQADRTPERDRLCREFASPRLIRRLLLTALSEEVRDHQTVLERMGVEVRTGETRLLGPGRMVVTSGVDCHREIVQADNIVIGCGTRRTSVHSSLGLMPFLRPESLLSGSYLPKRVCLLGGGSFGAGLASLLSLFGVDVRLIRDESDSDASVELAMDTGVDVAYEVDDCLRSDEIHCADVTQNVIDCRRCVGFTEHLGLNAIGIEPDECGQLWCASSLETWCSGVFGIGDVVGFSSDISTHPTDQSHRILNRIQHRIRRPHFLRVRSPRSAMAGY